METNETPKNTGMTDSSECEKRISPFEPEPYLIINRLPEMEIPFIETKEHHNFHRNFTPKHGKNFNSKPKKHNFRRK